MRAALRLAKRGLGRTSPNPAVGAVIVRNGRVIASGYHKRADSAHAEVEALAKLRGHARGGDVLYVTLEPCHHQGRTPPCTEAVLKAGIRKIVVGMEDPNPNVAGGGCEFLAKKGIDVEIWVLEEECKKLNEIFIKYVNTGTPFVIAKSALTIDGWTATSVGHSRWVTGEKSRESVHRLRNRVDAIMVGIGTVIADNPQLTSRLRGRKGKDPIRIIVDARLDIPDNALVLNRESPSDTLIVVGLRVSAKRIKRIQRDGVEIVRCPTRKGRINLAAMLEILGKREITSVLLEGGATLMGSMIRERLIDKFYVFKAPKILGGGDGIPMAAGIGAKRMDGCLNLRNIEIRRLGEDHLLIGYPEYSC